SKPEPGAGQKPGSAMEDLAERLKRMSELSKQSQQDQRTAQEMRKRAEDLLKRATPEERKRLEEGARQLGDEPANGARNPEPGGGQGSQDLRDGMNGGPGDTPGDLGGERRPRSNQPDATGAGPRPFEREEVVDARGKPRAGDTGSAPQREAAK